MQPQQPQYPDNYLDSIAVQQPVKTMSPLVLWGLIGAILVTLVVVILGVAGGGTSPTQRLTTLGAHMSQVRTIANDSQDNIQSGDLRSLNSSLTLTLTNSNRELQGPIAAAGAEIENEQDENVLAVTAEMTELQERLEDARLNAVFDRTYAREMAFYLKTMRADIGQVYLKATDDEFRQTLADTDAALQSLEEGFDDFNEG